MAFESPAPVYGVENTIANVYGSLPKGARIILPVDTKFKLGPVLTQEQIDFLDHYGFIHFKKVATPEEVAMITSEMERIEQQWAAEGRTSIYGIPLFFGNLNGKPFLQRLAFTTMYSDKIKAFVRDARFEPIRKLIGENARVGDNEKDGVVINRYINLPGSAYPELGWHNDGLRDIFQGHMPVKMFNVGLHLDDCDAANGGLRIIPESHKGSFTDQAFRKIHFADKRDDPAEIIVETDAGDLTVHDGRTWHRVARSTRVGAPSLRRSMYVPYLTGPYQPKDEHSATPPYHRLGQAIRAVKNSAVGLFK